MSNASEKSWPGLVGALLFDVQDAISRQEASDTSTNRRGLVRTLIAAVEGLAWMYREHVVEIAGTMDVLSESERGVLSESSYSVGEDGKISEQKRFMSTTAMIRLTTRIAARCAPGDQPDFGVEGWANLKRTIALRNRITHPKVENDLAISVDDIAQAKAAFFWFAEFMMGVMDRTAETFRDFNASLWETLDLLIAGDEKSLELYRRALEE